MTTLIVVLPIFALILAGWLCRRAGVLGENAATEISRFVVYLALPAVLFDITGHATWASFYQPGLIAAFSGGAVGVFALTIALRLWRGRHLADAGIDGLNASYANTAFMGFPIGLALFGQDSLAPVTIATILTVCILFCVSIILVEIGLQTETRAGPMLLNIGKSLARNPLILAPVLGVGAAMLGWSPSGGVERFLKLLGAAASPCALVALGLFLGQKSPGAASATAASLPLVALKLIAQPALTWVLATQIFHLTPRLTDITVVIAALPTGTGPFMLAELYSREAAVTSRTILISTVLSLVTISAYLGLSHLGR